VFPLPTVTLNPASLTIAAGDSAALTVTLHDASSPNTIRLASQNPAVARVDTAARSGAPVTVRAGVAGSAILLITATQYGHPVTAALPVTVTARPTP
jgi:uncharacterized protein YjdB